MSKTWKGIREEFMMSSNNVYTILQGPPVKTNFYNPLESPFNSFDGVTPEEQEIVMDEEMRLLLCGFQTENIRIQFDAESKLPRCLIPNPSLDPYMRSAIDRFFDVIYDLFIIRVHGHEIRANVLRSRIARVVTFKIHEKLDVIMAPILIDGHNQRLNSDEGFHDSDYALNTLTRNITAIRSTIRCYSEIIHAIYQNNLTGGEVIDLLEEKLQQAVRDRQELQLLIKEAWKIFFEIAGTWISTGLLEDISREFFIWDTKGIKATDLEKLEDNGNGLSSVTGTRCIMVPELCPRVIRPYMMSIFQCGHNSRPSGKTLENWTSIENPSRFIQKINTLTSELSASALKRMKSEGGFDEFLQCYFTVMLNSPYLTRIAIAMMTKGLPDRNYNEIPDGTLKSLTHLTILKDVGSMPLLNNFRFVKSHANLFEALVCCQYVTNNKESMRTRSDETSMQLADYITISVQLPPGLERMMSQDLIVIHSLIFRLQLRLTLAVAVLDQKKAEHSRKGVVDAAYRQPFQLLNNMAHYLLRFRLMLFHAIQDAIKVLNVNISKAKRIEDVSIYQRECAAQIFKEAKLTEEYIYIIEDLIAMIDSFAADYTFDKFFENYNMWLEQVESARFLVNDLGSFA